MFVIILKKNKPTSVRYKEKNNFIYWSCRKHSKHFRYFNGNVYCCHRTFSCHKALLPLEDFVIADRLSIL